MPENSRYYFDQQNTINKARLSVSLIAGLSILGFVLYKSLVYQGKSPFNEKLERSSESSLTKKLAD